MKDKYIFPCVIRYEDCNYYVNFVDLEEAFTDGENLQEALYNAKDVLGLILYNREQNNIDIPEPTKDFIKTNYNESISYIEIYMPMYRDMIEKKSVKKTLTIPKWLNDLGVENNLNFSQILQIGIKNTLGIKR